MIRFSQVALIQNPSSGNGDESARKAVRSGDVSSTIDGASVSGARFWRSRMVRTMAATLRSVPARGSTTGYCQSVFFEISANASCYFIFCRSVAGDDNIILSSRCLNAPG